MKKKLSILLAGLTLLSGVIAGCDNKKADDGVLKIGAALTPHTEILEYIKPQLEKEGVKLEIINVDDEAQLNQSLKNKEIDANYFQHLPYLESVSEEGGFDFEVAGKIHIEPIGLYSEKIKDLSELKDGDTIGIPNDTSNEYRALALLESKGVIKLKSGLANYSATLADIEENPKHLKFVEADAVQLPRNLKDLTAAIINTNVILEAKLDPKEAIVKESGDSPYANIVVVRKGDEDREDIQKLIKVLTSDDVKKFIEENYDGAVVPAF